MTALVDEPQDSCIDVFTKCSLLSAQFFSSVHGVRSSSGALCTNQKKVVKCFDKFASTIRTLGDFSFHLANSSICCKAQTVNYKRTSEEALLGIMYASLL